MFASGKPSEALLSNRGSQLDHPPGSLQKFRERTRLDGSRLFSVPCFQRKKNTWARRRAGDRHRVGAESVVEDAKSLSFMSSSRCNQELFLPPKKGC